MSQYGAPPPSGEPGDDRTRVPGGATPPGGPPPAWERPTRGPSEPDPWDQPAPTPPQVTQQQPAAPPQQPPPAPPTPPAAQPGPSYQQASYGQGYGQQPGQPAQPPQAGPWSTTSSGGGAAAAEAKGLVSALFDFSFTTFVTGRIVKIVYVLALAGLAVGLVGWLVSAFATGQPLFIVFALVAGPIGFVVYLCFVRMTLELLLAITRISEDIRLQVPDQRDRT